MKRFVEKRFSEYDAMRSLYIELMKNARGNKDKYQIIDTSALIPVLRGNNVVIERFVISTSFAHKDKYRMYLKIGAKAKLPDDVRLPGNYKNERFGNLSLEFNNSAWADKMINKDGKEAGYVTKGNSQSKDYHPDINTSFTPSVGLSYEVKELLGDAIKYDKADRSLVIECNSIQDAIHALDILPFGIDYKVYLLNL